MEAVRCPLSALITCKLHDVPTLPSGQAAKQPWIIGWNAHESRQHELQLHFTKTSAISRS